VGLCDAWPIDASRQRPPTTPPKKGVFACNIDLLHDMIRSEKAPPAGQHKMQS